MRRFDERKLEALQASYRTMLLAALRSCANGKWGLFDHSRIALRDHPRLRARLEDPAITALLDCGEEIERLRRVLGYAAPFPLHDRLLQLRSPRDANTPGEPKLAARWLAELLA